MAQTYSIEFKEEACKRVQSGIPAAQKVRRKNYGTDVQYRIQGRGM